MVWYHNQLLRYSPMDTGQTSSTIPDPPSSPRWKFDVFLSFRGEDTRKNFTEKLYKALCLKGIVTFRDDEELNKGKPISPALLEAIEKSKISVAILSTNYASSTWCLDELAKIVECMDESGSVVLPVFCGVEPSEVRYQHTGNFQKYFDEHERVFKNNKEKVDKWRKALTKVANLSGWDLKARYEREVIQEIVEHIFSELKYLDFVGLDRVKNIELDLLMELDEVRVIGICGMPGLGKTSIAQVISERICNKFDASSFIVNVGQIFKEKGLFHIQKQLCQDLLKREVKIQNVNVISSRLRYKRVLIILDDVTELKQIEALAGKDGKELNDRFGRGSRIIITTRDERLLLNCGAKIHKVKNLSENEARLLFYRKAFKKDHPKDGFAELSYGFVDYADGVPLALVVLGSFLLNRSIEEWSSALGRLKDSNYPGERKVSEILKVSFDGLHVAEQDIFLDIACFFKGDDASLVKRIFESCGYYPDISVNILIEKSLVSILGGKLWMHDLLQEMGKGIVRGESQKPGERSRLWLSTDALPVLRNNKGTEVVKGIFLSSPQQENVHLKADPFSEMYTLRLLKIKNVIFSGCPEFILSNKLSLFGWQGYPLKSLPSNFDPDKLVMLNLSQSSIETLWKETKKPLENLVIMDLSDCIYLTKTPDFNSVPKLERLILKGCITLSDIGESIGVLQRLIYLNLEGCKRLTTLPDSISLRYLEIFILSGCSQLKKLPEIGENMKQLSELHLDKTAIKDLPPSIKLLTGLTILDLKDCQNLLSLPDVICTLSSRQILNLSGCSNLVEFPKELGSLECLQELDASRSGIRQAPSSILLLKNLKQLSFAGCQGDLPAAPSSCCSLLTSSHLFPSDSASSNCNSNSIGLQLPSSFSGLNSLEILDLSDCNIDEGAIPDDVGSLSSLQNLDLSGNIFVSLPDTISQLSQLKCLRLNNCTKLQSLPNLPSSIQSVSARNCPVPEKYSNKLTVWTSLATGFCFINGYESDEEEKCHSIATSGADRLRQFFQTFYEERIPHSAFAISFPQTKVPSWFSRQSTGSSITIPLPPDIDNKSKWMGFAVCFVYIQKHGNLESTSVGRSIDELKVGFSNCFQIYTNDDPLEGPLVCKILDKNFVGPHGDWHYIPRRMFEERLNKRFIRAEIMMNSPWMEVKVCGARLIYKEDVAEFIWYLTCFDDWLPHHQVSESDQIEVDQTKNLLSSFQMGKAIDQSDQQYDTTSLELSNVAEDVCSSPTIFLIQIKPQGSREYSSSPKIVGQLRRNVESLLEKLLEVHDPRYYSYGFIMSLRAILPWFSHQSITGDKVALPIPQDLYNDNKWIGFTLYVSFTLPPGGSNICGISCHLSTGENRDIDVQHNHVILVPHDDNSIGSYRLCVIHIPRIRFPEQLNRNSILAAGITVSSPGIEIEMCGIRLVYKQDLKGLIQTITQCTVSSPPVYYELDDESLVSDRGQRFTCITTQNSLLEAAKSSENNPLENIIGRSFSLQRRKVLALQKPSRDLNSTVHQVNNFLILADIPFSDPLNKRDSVIKWKRNLHLLLQQLFMHSLSLRVTLSFGGEIINNFVQDFDPYSTYDCCFHRKDIPEGFTIRGEISLAQRVMSSLPPNLETDVNWMGLVVCAAVSVHQHPVAGHNLGLGPSHDLTCYLISSEGSVISEEGTCISENKGIWSYLPGFIWLQYMPRQHFEGRLDQQPQIEASFMTDSAGLQIQSCSIRLLYKQDVQEFKQALLTQQSTSLFGDVDLICQFLQDDDIDNKPPNHADEEDFNGTSRALCKKSEYESTRTPICQDETSGCTSSSSVSSSVKIVGQLGRNVESLLAQLFQGGYARYYDYGFILSCDALLPWFNYQSIGNQVQLPLPPDLYNDETWVGFALYVSFTLPPGAQLNKLGSEVLCLACHLSSNTGDVVHHVLSEVHEENIVGSHQLCFFHIPRVHFPEQFSLCSLLAASFDSRTPAVEFERCGIRVVYEQDLEGLIKTITHCAVRNPPVYFQRRLVSSKGVRVANITMSKSLLEEAKTFCLNPVLRRLSLSDTSLEVMSRERTSTTGQEMSPIHIHIPAETPLHPLMEGDSLIAWKRKLENLLLCFFEIPLSVSAVITLKGNCINELRDYNPYSSHCWCFNRKEIPGWFGWESRKDKVVFPLPPNLENDNSWMGLVLCAAYSVHKHQDAVLSLDSEICDVLMCNFKFSTDQLSGPGIGFVIDRNKFTRLYIGGFIWLLYVPCHHFKGQWNKQNQVEAFFMSDYPGLEVQRCSLRLLYKEDMVEFEQTKIQCFTSLFDNLNLIRQFEEDNAQHNKLPNHAYETNKDFNRSLIYNSCFPPNEIVEWFQYQSNGPSITIPLPPTLCRDATWIGLAFCASFSVLENPTADLDNMLDPVIPHHLTCYLETARGSLVHDYCTTNEEFRWMHLGGFIWLSYIPRTQFLDQLNECGCLEASIVSGHGGFSVDKCGFLLVYQHQEEELKQTIMLCKISLSDIYNEKQDREAAGASRISAGDSQGSGTGIAIASRDQEFDRASTYNSCFPPDDIVEWFGHHSNGPSVKIPLPPHLYREGTNWIGLAMCAYFSVLDHSIANLDQDPDIPHHLTCYLETDTGSLDHFHSYMTTNEEFKWLHLGGFIWVSYLPRRSLILDHQLNECIHLQASIGSDHPSFGVLKCGLRLLYGNDEQEFKKTIMHCRTSLSDLHNREQKPVVGGETRASSNDMVIGAHGERLKRIKIDTKGKGVLE